MKPFTQFLRNRRIFGTRRGEVSPALVNAPRAWNATQTLTPPYFWGNKHLFSHNMRLGTFSDHSAVLRGRSSSRRQIKKIPHLPDRSDLTDARTVHVSIRVASRYFLCAALLLLSAALGRADLATLNPLADTYLNSFSSTANFGTISIMKLGTAGSSGGSAIQRGLMRFDPLAGIPSGSIIQSVQLNIVVTRKPFTDAVPAFALFRVLTDWAEAEATWINRLDGIPWASPGGAAGSDYISVASASIPIMAEGDYTYNSTDALVADVQAWVDTPASNRGWMIISDMEGIEFTARRIESRESVTPPQLVVSFLPPPRIGSVALSNDSIQLGFTAEAPYDYEVRFAESVEAVTWQGLTNYSAKLGTFDVMFSESTTNSPQRIYRLFRTGPVP
jgi:hypothetical protein